MTFNENASIPAASSGVEFVSLPRGINVISGRQAQAARAALGLTLDALATASGVSASSIRRIEADQKGTVDIALRLQAYFERRGLTFIWTPNELGVKWRR